MKTKKDFNLHFYEPLVLEDVWKIYIIEKPLAFSSHWNSLYLVNNWFCFGIFNPSGIRLEIYFY